MNNLLQSLTSQRLHLRVPHDDLKRLLSRVKDGRGHDAKLSDAFYDSLEGILLDLRTVTIDNHDAEAFLKPVSKTDYPDYYEIIKEPMDLQTMLRKVKQKSYKSKAEFQDDLELIWSNCFVYNTGDNHPLRQCAMRLKAKATRLLKNITDRRERLDPPVPTAPPTPTFGPGSGGMNGVMVNGHGHSRKHSSTTVIIKRRDATPSASRAMSLAPSASPTPPPLLPAPPATAPGSVLVRRDSTTTGFGDQPAFVRTARGMEAWAALDRELSVLDVDLGLVPGGDTKANVPGPSQLRPRLPITDTLHRLITDIGDSEMDNQYLNGGDNKMNGDLGVGVGDKRKLAFLNGIGDGNGRPRKKARMTRYRFPTGGDIIDSMDNVDPVELWWEAGTSDELMANALPTLKYPSSFSLESYYPQLPPHLSQPSQFRKSRKSKSIASKPKPKLRKKKRRPPSPNRPPPKTLLGLINNNIRTLRRVRQVHDKFLVLNLANNSAADDSSSNAGGASGSGAGGSGGVVSSAGMAGPLPLGSSISGSGSVLMSTEPPDHLSSLAGVTGTMDEKQQPIKLEDGKEGDKDRDWDPLYVDDRPWRSRGAGVGMDGSKGLSGLDLGEREADDCLRWMGLKVLEHSGFQSTSKSALDVFTGVATEYLFNVGRTLRYLCDKYSKKMSAEEIILHTLFESGITHIRDLERYITDDVVRYGTRLTELEKKLTNAYNEVTVESALDDDAFFNEDEEEDNELVMGNFADAFGGDFLGLRELGIAEELGLQSLTIPKRLLRSKNKQQHAQKGAKPSEPPPPYPPPPTFALLDTTAVDSQIPGLLRPFFISKINSYATRTHPHQPSPFLFPPAPVPSQLEIELAREMGTEPPVPQAPPPVRNEGAPTVVLPDDPPPAGKTKSGPLGQILKPSTGSGTKKSKVKSGSGTGSSGHAPGGSGSGTGGGGGGVGAKEGVLGPAGPGPGVPPVLGQQHQQQRRQPPPVHLLANAHFTMPLHASANPAGHLGHLGSGPTLAASGYGHAGSEPMQQDQPFAILPGSAGSHTSSDGGKKSGSGNASPKKKQSADSGSGSGTGTGTTGMPSFVGVNA